MYLHPNTLALVMDSDKTLLPGHMQDGLFTSEHHRGSLGDFWAGNFDLINEQLKAGRMVDKSSLAYLSRMAKEARPGGSLEGLTEETLQEFGKKLKFFPGVPTMFRKLRAEIEEDPVFQDYGITLEFYVISAGLRPMLQASKIAPFMTQIYACDFFYDEDGVVSYPAQAMSNADKTGFVAKIHKGVDRRPHIVNVNSAMLPELRPIPYCNMVYLGDGPSDVAVMQFIRDRGGDNFAVFDEKPADEAYQKNPAKDAMALVSQGRAHYMFGANFLEHSPLYKALRSVLIEKAKGIVAASDTALRKGVGAPPMYIDPRDKK